MSLAFAFAAEGEGLALTLAGESLWLRPSGALWLAARGALIVADLHLEKGSFFAHGGQMLPPYDSDDTLARLEAEADAVDARTIVFLGDSFHDRRAEARLPAVARERLCILAAGRELIWVRGNHDPNGPAGLAGESVGAWRAGALTFSHEPSPCDADGAIAGHLHPCARVSARGGGVRRRCFVTDGRRLILPAFGAYAGGLNVRDAAFAALLGRARVAAVLGWGRVHPIGWRSLSDD